MVTVTVYTMNNKTVQGVMVKQSFLVTFSNMNLYSNSPDIAQ